MNPEQPLSANNAHNLGDSDNQAASPSTSILSTQPEGAFVYSPTSPQPKAGDVPYLDKVDLPKKLGEYRQVKSIFGGIGFALVAAIVGLAIMRNNQQMGYVISGVFGGFGAIISLASFISYRQLRKAEKKHVTYSQFKTDTATTYSTPLAPGAVSGAEVMENWLGPIIRVDKGAIGYEVLSKEVDKQSENTLLFTNQQVISLMLGPDDTAGLRQGITGSAASSFINYSAEDAGSKGQEFRMLHYKHWDQLVAPLLQQPLATVLQNHLNYGIPYNKIQSVEVKKSLLNPGFVLHINDGSKLRYAVMQKDRMDEIKNYLQQKVSVSG